MREKIIFSPQPGPQETFSACAADIAIYGGAAGGGKTFALLHEPLRHIHVPGFEALVIRKYLTDIKGSGGLWSEAEKMYPHFGGRPNRHDWEWRFPGGARIKFGGVDSDYAERYRGWQACLLAIDELTAITQEEFWYLFGRNRSTCSVRPYVRATCNPDADSWLAEFLGWWWDSQTGYPIAERAGKARYLLRRGNQIVWGARREDLVRRYPDFKPEHCKSVVFIPAKLSDNRFLGVDYEGNLLAQDDVQRERLLSGNWKVRYEAGSLFREEWLVGPRGERILESAPDDVVWVRAWDLAATADVNEGFAQGGADFTAGVLLGRSASTGRYYVGDLVLGRWDPGEVEQVVMRTAKTDGKGVRIWINQERAGAGKHQLSTFVRLLSGYTVDGGTESGDKTMRLSPVSAQAKHGNIFLIRGGWNRDFLLGLRYLPKGHDDVGDALAAAFYQLTEQEDVNEIARAFVEDRAEWEEVNRAFDPNGVFGMSSW